MDREKNSRRIIGLLIALCVLLCAALAVTALLLYDSRQAAAQAMAQDDLLPPEEPEDDVIPVEMLMQYAQKYNVSIEFLQNFFDDVIVYKDSAGIVYEPIDPSLPKSSYNWDNLVQANGRIEYIDENGVSAKVGVDVSKHQGEIDWESVKADGIDYAIIRLGNRGYATGKMVMDDYFEQNMKGALAAGLDVGVYYYSQAVTVEEALEEARTVIDSLEGYDVTYPVVFDFEEVYEDTARTKDLTAEEITDITIAFCEAVKEAGYRPMIYANIKWFIAHLELSRLTEYDKWFAQYFRAPFFPYEFQMWQYTSTGKVDGIQGNVDLNLCFAPYGDEEEEQESEASAVPPTGAAQN